MYCRYCGKELPDDSNFCPNCGKKQNEDSKVDSNISFVFLTYVKEHKKSFYVLLTWFLLHMTLYISSEKYDRCDTRFYPFNMSFSNVIQGGRYSEYYYPLKFYTPKAELLGSSLNYYDSTELFVYVIIIPFVIWGIVRMVTYIKRTYKNCKKRYNQWQESNAQKTEEYQGNIVARKVPQKEDSNTEPVQVKHVIEEVAGSKKQESKEASEEDAIYEKQDTDIDIQPQEGLTYTEANNEVKKMPLLSRFVGSIIDKILIIIIFIVCFMVISPYGAPGKMGKYIGILDTPLYLYEYIDKSQMNKYGTYTEGVSTAYQDLERLESEPPHIGSTLELDKNITFSFILLNLLFYFLSEAILSASPGKRMLGGVILDGVYDKINFEKAFTRGLFSGAFMTGTYFLLHLAGGLTNIIVVVVFFLILDLPVLFTKRSLLDLCTGTTYAKK